MTNVCRPGSAKDMALQKYPRAICIRITKRKYIVLDKPKSGVEIGLGDSAELAWHSTIGLIKTRQNFDR